MKWYCRRCWETGLAGVTIRSMNDRYIPPNMSDLLHIASLCHGIHAMDAPCTKPDIRIHYNYEN